MKGPEVGLQLSEAGEWLISECRQQREAGVRLWGTLITIHGLGGILHFNWLLQGFFSCPFVYLGISIYQCLTPLGLLEGRSSQRP